MSRILVTQETVTPDTPSTSRNVLFFDSSNILKSKDSTGTVVQYTAFASLTGTGFLVQTGSSTAVTRSITGGTGITVSPSDGVTANPVISLNNTAVTPGSYGAASAVPIITIDAQGRITAASTASIAISSANIGDFNEAAQDAVGNILTDSSSIDFTYNDGGNTITAVVLPGGVDHNSLLNYVANRHIDHSAVSISAGTGLSGGGDITVSRTLSIASTGTPGTYRSVTTNAQGQVTAGTNPTTLAGYGITDAQPLDAELTAIAALTGNGLIAKTGAGTVSVRTVTGGTGITVTDGDGVTANPVVTLNNTAVTPGTYGSANLIPVITIDAQGRITNAVTSGIDLTNQEASATASTTTTSGTDVLMNSMSLSLTAGKYLLMFSGTIASNTNDANIFVSLYGNSTQIAHTQRQASPQFAVGLSSPSIDFPIATQGFFQVSGTMTVEVRWRRSAGTATMLQRTFNAVRISQ